MLEPMPVVVVDEPPGAMVMPMRLASPITNGEMSRDNWALLNQVPSGNILIRSPCRGAHDVNFLISGARTDQGGAKSHHA